MQTSLRHSTLRHVQVAAVITLALSALSGCVAPKPEPFREFRDSLVTLKSATSAAMTLSGEQPREIYIQEASTNPDAFDGWAKLSFTLNDGPYSYNPPKIEPLYAKVMRAQEICDNLNQAYVEYAKALADLADNKLLDQASVDTVAASVNAKAGEVVDGLNSLREMLDTGERKITLPHREQAIVSTAVAALWNQYLISKQSSYLESAIDQAQQPISDLSEAMRVLAGATALGIRADFQSRQTELIRSYDRSTDPAQRRAIVVEQLQIREEFIAAMDALRNIDESYQKLPKAHANLKQAAGGSPKSLDDLKSFFQQAQSVAATSKKLADSNKGT